MKQVVLNRRGDDVQFHPRLLELAAHYHFAPRPCAPGRGNEKGRVERAIQFIRSSFFAARPFTTLEDFNRQARQWRDQVAYQRRCPMMTPGLSKMSFAKNSRVCCLCPLTLSIRI